MSSGPPLENACSIVTISLTTIRTGIRFSFPSTSRPETQTRWVAVSSDILSSRLIDTFKCEHCSYCFPNRIYSDFFKYYYLKETERYVTLLCNFSRRLFQVCALPLFSLMVSSRKPFSFWIRDRDREDLVNKNNAPVLYGCLSYFQSFVYSSTVTVRLRDWKRVLERLFHRCRVDLCCGFL